MKMHDRDIKNVEIFFDNNLSKDKNFKASISLESIKNISRYAKDTFIKWSSNKNNVQLIGGFVNTISLSLKILIQNSLSYLPLSISIIVSFFPSYVT